VDDDLQKTGTTVGEFTMLSSKVMFVGGRPRSTSVQQLTPATYRNFKGCLKQVSLVINFRQNERLWCSKFFIRPYFLSEEGSFSEFAFLDDICPTRRTFFDNFPQRKI